MFSFFYVTFYVSMILCGSLFLVFEKYFAVNNIILNPLLNNHLTF